jgi:hypothetical protein
MIGARRHDGHVSYASAQVRGAIRASPVGKVVWEELDTPDLADTVLNWITTHLGEPNAALAHRAAGILGAPDAPDLTASQLADDLGADFIPAILWLAAGLVAAYGGGDTAWLRRHDPHLNAD